MTRFSVEGEGWEHPVLVGALAEAGAELAGLSDGRRLPLVTDEQVWALHGARIAALAEVEPLFVPAGEAAKTWDTLHALLERFHALGVTRDTPVIAFGGGSVGDLAGLAASLFKRGCPVVHIPTTLLAQVDSAVGGKTAIDAFGHKNLMGTFHPPALVVADIGLLATLDPRQLRAGYAEVVKYGLIGDAEFFAWCEAHGGDLLAGDDQARSYAVDYCLHAKAAAVSRDLHDRTGRRALLNFGHTFAHAIEAAAGLGVVLHGEAVAIGLVLAFELSAELGLCSAGDAQRVRAHFVAAGLPTRLADFAVAGPGLLPLMLADKKAGAGAPVLILARGIGQAFVSRDVTADQLAAFLGRTA
ncbi:3-dehydroquinate synthase family protein [Sphingomonas sp.]|uniref:3-dehydroquinate synthase family protein n=1 Tax=Sphingomonas sp. TaxID=28214 RepID=UPI00286EAE4A|nr:3-dehydroquinate synthase family protein [Sphingomonas sp.]